MYLDKTALELYCLNNPPRFYFDDEYLSKRIQYNIKYPTHSIIHTNCPVI